MKPIICAKHRQCLCLQHENAHLKLKGIQQRKTPNEFLKAKSKAEINVFLEALPMQTVSYSEWQKEELQSSGNTIKKMHLHKVEKPKEEFIAVF